MATWTKKLDKEFFDSIIQLQLDRHNITVKEVEALEESGFFAKNDVYWYQYYTHTTKQCEEWKEKCWEKCKEIGMPKKYFERFFKSLDYKFGLKIQEDEARTS
jgi:hypothetical protein